MQYLSYFGRSCAGDVKGKAIRREIRRILWHGHATKAGLVRQIGWWTGETIGEELDDMLISREICAEHYHAGIISYRMA